MKNFRTSRISIGVTRSGSTRTLKSGMGKAFIVLLLFATLNGSMGVLSAQDGAEGSFKKLLIMKFDSNRDSSLTGLEKTKAVEFLKKLDSDNDGQISLHERKLAITELNKMRDLGKKIVAKNMTPEDRNAAQRGAAWGDFIKKLPHSTEGRTFTKMPGDKGFSMKGDTFVDPTKVKGVAPGSDRVTAEELDKKLANLVSTRKRKQEQMGVKPLKKEVKRAVPLRERDYYAGTTILATGGEHTVVPQGAVLNLPPKLADMVVKKPKGTLLIWPKFVKKYSRFVTTKEVSWERAKGEDPITEMEQKALAIGGKVVVAVFNKNPISVIEPPAEEEGVIKGDVASGAGSKR